MHRTRIVHKSIYAAVRIIIRYRTDRLPLLRLPVLRLLAALALLALASRARLGGATLRCARLSALARREALRAAFAAGRLTTLLAAPAASLAALRALALALALAFTLAA